MPEKPFIFFIWSSLSINNLLKTTTVCSLIDPASAVYKQIGPKSQLFDILKGITERIILKKFSKQKKLMQNKLELICPRVLDHPFNQIQFYLHICCNTGLFKS